MRSTGRSSRPAAATSVTATSLAGLLGLFAGACATEPSPASPVLTTPTVTADTTDATDAADATEHGAPTESTPSTAVAASDVEAVVPDGFDAVLARVTDADGTVCEMCLWLADDGDERRRGLMFVTDLGAADGMAFDYGSPHSGTFWMKNTVLPLSIAFYDGEGAYLDAFDMAPCTDDPCPNYATPNDFVVAIETPQGALASLGIGPGSNLDLTDLPCDDVP